MDSVNFNNKPFSFCNPYKTYFSYFEIKVLPSLFKKNVPLVERDKLLELADKVTDWGKKLFFKNYEKQIDFAGKAAKVLDWSIFGIVGGVEGIVIVNNFIHFHLYRIPLFKFPSFLLNILLIPSAIFFITMGLFEGFVEFINLHRVGYFLHNIQKRKPDPLAGMQWMKERYFTLDKVEEKKIYQYIEKRLPHLHQTEKAKRFDQIAQKTLRMKYNNLKRRISPGLAKEVVSQLDTITRDLQSFFPAKRAEATQRAKLLMESMSRQAKNKVLIHFLGILAISCTIISMSVFLSGTMVGAFFAIMGTITVSLVLISLLVDKGLVAKEVEKFYDALAKFNLQVKGYATVFPSKIKDLSQYRSLLPRALHHLDKTATSPL